MKQKTSIASRFFYLIIVVTALVFMQSCTICKRPAQKCRPKVKRTCQKAQPTDTSSSKKASSTYDSNNPEELDFDVKNETGKTVYVACFAYQRKRDFGHWRWDKSPVYKIEPNQTVTVDVDTIPDEQDRNYVFGYLAVFNNQQAADDAIYELTDDRYLLDLDLLIQLKGKMVTLTIERYGSKGEFFEYDFVNKNDTNQKKVPELDFPVENKTGKPILVTCFVYEKKAKGHWIASLEEKDDMSVWRFDKTPVIKLMPDEVAMIDVDTILGDRDRKYMRGDLAIFDIDEEKLAQQSTLELLDTRRKLNLGELPRLNNKKVVIEIEKYGIMQDFVDFIIKPAHEIDFKQLKRK